MLIVNLWVAEENTSLKSEIHHISLHTKIPGRSPRTPENAYDSTPTSSKASRVMRGCGCSILHLRNSYADQGYILLGFMSSHPQAEPLHPAIVLHPTQILLDLGTLALPFFPLPAKSRGWPCCMRYRKILPISI